MTDNKEEIDTALPSIFPFLLNLILAGGLGAAIHGALGAAIGAGLLIAVFLFVWFVRLCQRRADDVQRFAKGAWRLLKPLLALALLPAMLVFTAVCLGVGIVWQRVGRGLLLPSVAMLARMRDVAGWALNLVRGLFAVENLPATALNALLLLIIGCVAVGIEVAFYSALAAVPILIFTLAMVALDSSKEPEQD